LLADSGHAQKRFEGAGNDYLSLLVGSSCGLNRFVGLRRIAGSQEASNKAEAYGERKLQKEGRSASGTLHGPNLRVSFRISIYSPTGTEMKANRPPLVSNHRPDSKTIRVVLFHQSELASGGMLNPRGPRAACLWAARLDHLRDWVNPF
jgi:hypothetical protein